MASTSRRSRGRRRAEPAGPDSSSRIPATRDEIAYEVASQNDLLAGTPLYVSPQVETILGYAPEEFLRDPTLWFRILHPDDVAQVRELTVRLAEDDVPQVRTYRLKHKHTGAYRWFEDRTVPTRDARGRLRGYCGIARDVTEYRQAEERLRRLFKGFPLPTYAWRKVGDDFVLTDYNDAGERITGGAVADVVGRSAREFYADVPEIAEDMARCLREDTVIAKEMPYRFRSTGQTRLLAVTYAPVQPDTVLVHTQDLTERERMEQALRVSEERYRLLLQQSVEAIYRCDPETGHVLEANPAFLDLLGYTAEEAQALTLYDIVALDQSDVQAVLGRLLESGSLTIGPRRWRRKDGSIVDMEVTAIVIRQQGKASVFFVGRDVTERQKNEARLRDLLEAAPDAMMIVNQDGRIVLANRQTTQLLGYSPEELLGKPVEVLVPERFRAKHVEHRAGYSRHPTVRSIGTGLEFSALRKDGSEVPVEISLSPVESGDRVLVTAVLRDMTARRQADEATRRSREQLRDLARSLRTARERERTLIARQIHDELGQELTALKMDLAWLKHRLPAQSKPLASKTRAMLGLIDKTIEKVRTIATELRPAILDTLGLAAAIEWETHQFARRSGIPCQLDLPTQQLQLDADRSTDVFRILQEALTNVARHANAKLVTIRLRASPGELVLEVQDDGRGINEPEAGDARSLGLLGMRERALAWGGEVGVRALPEGGTSVTARIPLP